MALICIRSHSFTTPALALQNVSSQEKSMTWQATGVRIMVRPSHAGIPVHLWKNHFTGQASKVNENVIRIHHVGLLEREQEFKHRA